MQSIIPNYLCKSNFLNLNMKLLILFIFFSLSCFAEYELAIINDADGYTFVRSSPKKTNNKIDSIPNGTIVWLSENEGNWISIEYRINDIHKSGFVYKDRIETFSSFSKFMTLSSSKNSKTLVFNEDTITIKTKKVDKSKIKIIYAKNDKHYVSPKINNREFWGTDGGMPNSEYESITYAKGNSVFYFPKYEIENFFQPFLSSAECYFNTKNNTTYIVANNGDGAGSYIVVWEIIEMKITNTNVIIPF